MLRRITMFVLAVFLLYSCNLDLSKETKVLFVDHYLDTASGVGPVLTYRVKENESDDWTFFYSGIQDFDYDPGYIYKIKVEITDTQNPPADASSKDYKLIELLEKNPMSSDVEFSLILKDTMDTWVSTANDTLTFLSGNIAIEASQATYDSVLNSIQDDSIEVVTGIFKHTESEKTIELLKIEAE